MILAPGEIQINEDFPWCACNCCPWELPVFPARRQNLSPVICEGTWLFSGPFYVFLYKWAVLHMPGSGQHCQSFKGSNRTEWVRDHAISHGEESALAEKSQREQTRFLCCKDCKMGRKEEKWSLLVLQARELPSRSYLKETLRRSFWTTYEIQETPATLYCRTMMWTSTMNRSTVITRAKWAGQSPKAEGAENGTVSLGPGDPLSQ